MSDTMQPNMQKYPLTEEQMDALLNRARMGVISTIGEDGYPYGTPVNFVVMDGRIFFHGRKVGEKVSNLKRDPRCCFTVVEEKGFERCDDGACNTTSLYESVIIRGKVQIIEDDDMKMRILRATVDKLTPERKEDAIEEKGQADPREERGRHRREEGPAHRDLRDRPRIQDRQVPLRRTRAQNLPVKHKEVGPQGPLHR